MRLWPRKKRYSFEQQDVVTGKWHICVNNLTARQVFYIRKALTSPLRSWKLVEGVDFRFTLEEEKDGQ